MFNKNILIDDGLGELNIFLDGQIPGIELFKLLTREERMSGYLCIQICIESTKVRGMLMINSLE